MVVVVPLKLSIVILVVEVAGCFDVLSPPAKGNDVVTILDESTGDNDEVVSDSDIDDIPPVVEERNDDRVAVSVLMPSMSSSLSAVVAGSAVFVKSVVSAVVLRPNPGRFVTS